MIIIDKNITKKDNIICRCEEVTEAEIRQAIKEGHTTLKSIKKKTRAGMGLCQGRTCSNLIRKIIVEMTDKKPGDVKGDKARYPIKPVKIKNLTSGK